MQKERDSSVQGSGNNEETYLTQLSNLMLGVLRSVKQDVQKREGEVPDEAAKLRYSEQTALVAICGCCLEQALEEGGKGTENKDGINMGVRTSLISETLDLAPSTVTPLLDALENKGLLVRRRTKEDRRVVQVLPTRKGWEMADYLRKRNQKRISEMLYWLGEDDCAQLLRIFKKIVTYYSSEGRM